MTLSDARKTLGLGPDDDPSRLLPELRQARERIAEMVRTAPNEALALRYQEGLVEFDQALAAVREHLEATGKSTKNPEERFPDTWPSPALDAAPAASVKAGTQPPLEDLPAAPPPQSKAPKVAWILTLLLLAVAAAAWHLKGEEEKKVRFRMQVTRLGEEAAEYIKERRWPEAAAALDALERVDPTATAITTGRQSVRDGIAEEQAQFIGYWNGQAGSSHEAGRWDEAESAVRQVLDKFPGEKEATALLGRIRDARMAEVSRKILAEGRDALRKRQWDDAVRAADKILASHPQDDDAAALRKEATTAKEKEAADLTEAKALLDRARAMDQGRYDETLLDTLRRASGLAPADPEIKALLEKVSAYSRTLRVPEDYPSPAAALAQARDRDRIVIGPGTWDEPVIVAVPVEIQGSGPDTTILRCEAGKGSAITFTPAAEGSRVTGITFRHLSLDPSPERYSVALVAGAAVEFVDCRFLEGSGHGLAVIESGRAKATRCRFAENAWNGISVSGVDSLLEATDSECLGNFSHGVESWEGASVILTGNRCEDNARNGIHADNGAGSAVVERNQLNGNREFGLVMGGAGSGRAAGNTARGNLLGGFVIRAAAAAVAFSGNEAVKNEGPGLVLDLGLPPAAYADNLATGNGGQQILANADLSAGDAPPSPAPPPPAGESR